MRQKLQEFRQNTFSSLKIRNFRLYFIGQSISVSGTFMQSIAQAWLVLTLSHSGTVLGIVTALQFLPILLFGPWGGVAADNFSKKKLMLVTQSAQAILAVVLGVLVVTNLIQIWMMYIFALSLGLINVFDNPTRQTFVSEMVGENQLKNAISLNASLMNLARVIGPTIAGIMIATLGLAPAFFFNGVSFVAVIVVLMMMNDDELYKIKTKKAENKFLTGLHYIFSKPILRATFLMMAIIGTLTYEFQVSLPLLAQNTFHGNAGSYAALSSAMGIGAIMGGIFTASKKKTDPKMLVNSGFLFGMFILLVSIMPSLYSAVIVMTIVGFFSIYFTALGNSIMQLGSEPHLRGRVMAFWSMAFMGSTAIGGPIIGWVGDHVGARWSLAVGGFAAILAATWGIKILSDAQLKMQTLKK